MIKYLFQVSYIDQDYQHHSLNYQKVNTISMSQTAEIITPIPKLYSVGLICSEVKLASQEKPTDGQDRNDNASSLKILGCSLSGTVSHRRNSAFSIYEPGIGLEDLQNECKNQNESFSSEEMDHQLKRSWRREKKDKREMSRLETKNLNRYFRSKINQMLRDIKQNQNNEEESKKADKVLEILNKSNKIMFSEIREIIKDEWLQKKLKACSGVLLKYIHRGKMGMQSKLIMLKYFNKILKAIRNPDNFTCWK